MRFRDSTASLKREELRALLEAAPTPMLISRVSDGLILDANALLAETLGLPSKNIIGRKALDFYEPADGEALLERPKEEGCVRSHEVRATKADGTPLWVVVSLQTAVFDGEPALIAGFHDITDSKRAEQALRESEEKYRRLVQDSIDGIVIAEGQEIRFVNSALLDMVGCESEEEMVGRPFTDFVSPEYREELQERNRARERGRAVPAHYEFKALRKDGSTFIAEVSIGRIAYQGRTATQAIVRDITERKQMAKVLQETREELERTVERQMQRGNAYELTFRELTVLHLVAEGRSDREIGATLGISTMTIHKHVASILSKMKADSPTDASVRAVREGLLD